MWMLQKTQCRCGEHGCLWMCRYCCRQIKIYRSLGKVYNSHDLDDIFDINIDKYMEAEKTLFGHEYCSHCKKYFSMIHYLYGSCFECGDSFCISGFYIDKHKNTKIIC